MRYMLYFASITQVFFFLILSLLLCTILYDVYVCLFYGCQKRSGQIRFPFIKIFQMSIALKFDSVRRNLRKQQNIAKFLFFRICKRLCLFNLFPLSLGLPRILTNVVTRIISKTLNDLHYRHSLSCSKSKKNIVYNNYVALRSPCMRVSCIRIRLGCEINYLTV